MMKPHQRPPVIVAGGVAPDLTYRRSGFSLAKFSVFSWLCDYFRSSKRRIVKHILIDDDIDIGHSAIATQNAKMLGASLDTDGYGNILTVCVHFLDRQEQKAISMQRDDALILLLTLKHILLDTDHEQRRAN